MKAVDLDDAFLRRHPLPEPDPGGDKEERGRVLVAGGASETPGAVLLAAIAALRVGAGKLQMAVGRGIAPALAIAVPEALVAHLPETRAGSLALAAAPELVRRARKASAWLVGPGMDQGNLTARLVRKVLASLETPVVIDAAALAVARPTQGKRGVSLGSHCALTPHAGELASLVGASRDDVQACPARFARELATRTGALVVLKGATTFVVPPDGPVHRYRGANAGLATSGSGDTLAGILAGLRARGADPLTAAAWAVRLHAAAGDRLAEKRGRLGFLASELLDELPPLLTSLVADSGGMKVAS